MPEICRFLGIVIAIFYKDHSPPHFHAKYGDKMGIFSIEEIKLLEGDLPPRVVSLVIEWAMIHKKELLIDWELAIKAEPLNKIEPLT